MFLWYSTYADSRIYKYIKSPPIFDIHMMNNAITYIYNTIKINYFNIKYFKKFFI